MSISNVNIQDLNKIKRTVPKSCWGKIVKGSMGSFLEPPTHPTHLYSVKSVFGNTFYMSIESAADDKENWLDERTRAEAKKIMSEWKPLPIENKDVQEWINKVLKYFKHCYQGKNGEWEAGSLIIDTDDSNLIKNQDKHAGVHLIRKYYPNFKL